MSCSAITARGTPCSRKSKVGQDKCTQHLKCLGIPDAIILAGENRCQGLTLKKMQCKKNKSEGSNFCIHHIPSRLKNKPSRAKKTSLPRKPSPVLSYKCKAVGCLVKIKDKGYCISHAHQYRLSIDECVICMESVSSRTDIPLHCGHLYHNICIKKWGLKNDNCPTCREQFDANEKRLYCADMIERENEREYERENERENENAVNFVDLVAQGIVRFNNVDNIDISDVEINNRVSNFIDQIARGGAEIDHELLNGWLGFFDIAPRRYDFGMGMYQDYVDW
jgi:hypothetical protein